MASRFNAEHIGSLLRPAYLLEARRKGTPAAEMREIEDKAILEVLRLQEEVGLELVTTKRSDVGPSDDFRRRIDEASRFVPLERLALSPQCGFATIDEGNEITPEAERAKLEVMVKTAQAVWGSA